MLLMRVKNFYKLVCVHAILENRSLIKFSLKGIIEYKLKNKLLFVR